MKSISKILSTAAIIMAMMVATSCTSYKHVPYIQNSDEVDLTAATSLYDARIMPKDILTITVTCPEDPETARIFNLVVQADRYGEGNLRTQLSTQMQLQQYIVSNEGMIDFPLLGKISVVGRTKTELEEYIADRITGTYLKTHPIVIVNMANYKVSVAGEVAHPGVYTAANGKINVFEALAMAGDMTIYGRRDNVKIIRENAQGVKTVTELDLTDANIISSPYYQLQQNDVVVVTPNKTKSKNSGIGSETNLWFTSISIVVSVASLLYNILK